MENGLAFTIKQFELQTRLYRNVLEGMGELGKERFGEHTNHLSWLAGHILSSRYMMAHLTGIQVPAPYPDLFEHGKGIDNEVQYPAVYEYLKHWDEISDKVIARLKELKREDLEAKAPFMSPMGDTIGEFIAFFSHHEPYHIGQMGILRKHLGKEAMSYA